VTWARQQGFEPIDVGGGLQFVLDTAGSVACETDFKTAVRILDPNGDSVSMEKKEDIPYFSDIPEGSVLEWEATTMDSKGLTKGKEEGTPDRINIDITAMDPSYMARVSDMAIDAMTDEEVVGILHGDTSGMTRYLEANPNLIDPELAQVTFYSQTVETNSDGIASGRIPIDPAWGKSLFSINFHYGYSKLAEASTESKTERRWTEEIGPILVEVLATVALAAITGGAALAIRAGWLARAGAGAIKIDKVKTKIKKAQKIAFAIEMAQMAKAYFRDGFGIVGMNRQGCSFPLVGFNHVYSFDTDYLVSLTDESGEIDFSTLDENKIESLIQQNLARNLAVASLMTGLLIWALSR
tara:strand:+ start:3538 stop:4599 length:1062 start_codon:yes stop_codon:yes gene_type:complete